MGVQTNEANRQAQPVATFELDANFTFVSANDAFCQLVGVPTESLIGADAGLFIDRLRGADLSAIQAAIHGTGTATVSSEAQFVNTDNTSVWVRLSFEVHRNENRFSGLSVHVVDVSDLREIEDELTRRLKVEDVLREVALDLAESGTAATGIAAAMERVGHFLGFDALLLRHEVPAEQTLRSTVAWSAKPRRYDAEAEERDLPIAGSPQLRTMLDGRGSEYFRLTAEDYSAYPVHSLVQLLEFGFEPEILVVPVRTDERVGLLIGVRIDQQAGNPDESRMVEGFSSILAQVDARRTAENVLNTQLELEDNLRLIATRLLESKSDEQALVYHLALGLMGRTLELQHLGLWHLNEADPGATLIAQYAELPSLLEDGIRISDPVTDEAVPTIVRGSNSPLGALLTAHGQEALRSDQTALVVPLSNSNRVIGHLVGTPFARHEWSPAEISAFRSLAALLVSFNERVEMEQRFEVAFAASPIGMVLRDLHGEILGCNQAFLGLVGRPAHDLVGSPIDAILDPDECDVADVRATLSTVSPHGQAVDVPYLRPNGETVWGRMLSFPIRHGTDEVLMSHVEDVTVDLTDRQELEHLARHDELTGLANRRSLVESLTELIGDDFRPEAAAVILFDVDRFKVVNDSLGHAAGDELLKVLSARLRMAVRPGDIAARLGGDEFVVVLRGPVDLNDAEEVGDRLLDLVAGPVELDDHEVFASVSIGIAFPDPADRDVSDVLRHADAAMYSAKAKGRNRYVVFDQRRRNSVANRSKAESELRSAIASGELATYYQPEFDLTTREIVGVEALARWPHPTRGLVSADSFIPIAEDTGLIVDLGSLVLHEACSAASRWRSKLNDSTFKLRVNMSAVQLDTKTKDVGPGDSEFDLVNTVSRALARSGLPASGLCLELTETALMQDPDKALRVLNELVTKVGVTVAIDDFGTGFSSLAYLKRLPVHSLKIDREFVDGLTRSVDGHAIVSTIVTLAHSMRLEIVAEGIEDEVTVRELLQLGVRRGQGFYLAKPLPHYEFDKLLFSQSGALT